MSKVKKAIGIASVTAGVAYLAKKENRSKLKAQVDKVIGKFNPSSYINKLGKPEEKDDAKMVDEGAMTSVKYYNQLRGDHKTSK